MKKELKEAEVLKLLNIENFRQLSKEKVIQMASVLDKMTPEVAKAALEQFPVFSKTLLGMINDTKDTLIKGMEENGKNVSKYNEAALANLKALEKELEKDKLSFEEKMRIVQEMGRIQDKIGEKDKENKQFIAYMGAMGVAALAVGGAALNAALGGKAEVNLDTVGKLIGRH